MRCSASSPTRARRSRRPGTSARRGSSTRCSPADAPLATGADDLRLSGNVLGRAEGLAAELWGAEYCRFAVNGSTQANEACALAVGRPGERVAVSRTAHKSIFAGLVLAGLEPVWLAPEVDRDTGLTVGLPLAEVQRALDQDVRAMLIVEPAYTGVISDLAAISELTRAAGVPLVVDSAWGAHFGLDPGLPPPRWSAVPTRW